jgi:hypothetical protein
LGAHDAFNGMSLKKIYEKVLDVMKPFQLWRYLLTYIFHVSDGVSLAKKKAFMFKRMK